MELLRRSVLYVEPVDPIYWCGALRKCEGRILPCLKVQFHTYHRLNLGQKILQPSTKTAPAFLLYNSIVKFLFTVNKTVVTNSLNYFAKEGMTKTSFHQWE